MAIEYNAADDFMDAKKIVKYNTTGDYVDVLWNDENARAAACFIVPHDSSKSFVRIYNAKKIAEFICAQCHAAKDGLPCNDS